VGMGSEGDGWIQSRPHRFEAMRLNAIGRRNMLLGIAALAGCGGGGTVPTSSQASPAPPPPPAPPQVPPSLATRARAGVLFYASYLNENETRVLSNSSIVGALFQIYWSAIEPAQGDFRWSALDAHISRWRGAGKKVALRVLWSSSGYWPDPSAKRPTPQWVWNAGARFAYHAPSDTEIPLFWDPIYRSRAHDFLDALATRYDSNTDILFIDVTPGAETNPYRFGTIDENDPGFRDVFLQTVASDGQRYGDALWLATLQSYLSSVRSHFPTMPLLATLNRGAMPDAPSRMTEIGDIAALSGLHVGQNGIKGSSYINLPSESSWFRWGDQTGVFQEMSAATGLEVGTMQDVVNAAIRVKCDFLNVYAQDVVKATIGTSSYDPAWDAALRTAAADLGR